MHPGVYLFLGVLCTVVLSPCIFVKWLLDQLLGTLRFAGSNTTKIDTGLGKKPVPLTESSNIELRYR